MRRIAIVALGAAACAAPPPGTSCTDRAYRIVAITLPLHPGDTTTYGLDLDGDGNVDNAYGSIVRSVTAADPELADINVLANARLATGAPSWRIVVDTCDDGTTRVELAPIPITVLADPLGSYEPIASDPVLRARIVPDLDATGDTLDGVLAFGMPMPASERDLLAPYAAYLTSELAAGTSPLAAKCDLDHDGVCSVDELMTPCECCLFCDCCPYGFVETLFAPDVRLDGQEALSFGLGIHATLTP